MTGGVGSANSCGHFSAALKYAGYDNLIVEGRANLPVMIWIDDGKVSIIDGSSIWNMRIGETINHIRNLAGDNEIQVLAIGPAGSNLVRGAAVITNRARAAGRCGLGAVMGAKNLKAVAVHGTGSIEVAHPQEFMRCVDKARNKLERSAAAQRRRDWGTLWATSIMNRASLLGFHDFYDDRCPDDHLSRIGAQVLRDRYETGRIGYTACPIACSHRYRIAEGPYAGLITEGIESNDHLNFAGRLGIDDPAAIIRAHYLCNELGLDQDNASAVIAWAINCYEHGILTDVDTDGMKLSWNNPAVVMELLHKIAYRHGIGNLLAEGSWRAAQILGRDSESLVVHIKGQDSIESIRAAKGWALGCVVSTRGGTHTRGANLVELYPDIPTEFSRREFGLTGINPPLDYENKAELVVYYERLQAVLDSLGICLLCSNWGGYDQLGPDELAGLYSTATGIDMTADELMTMGERLHNLEKAFNTLHAGFGRQDDYPPERFMREPVRSGPAKGELLKKSAWDEMLSKYYKLHGWNTRIGWQNREQLRRLGLDEVADRLEAAGRLADVE